MRRSILSILICSVCLTAQVENKSIRPAGSAHKVALVIGNSNYLHVPKIPPAVNDAADMAAALRKLGFDVEVKNDLAGEALVAAVVRFSRAKVQAGDVAFVYYSGHGGQIAGENYLLPVDYQPPADDELVERRAYKMSLVRDALERTGASVRVLIFDACRDSPVTTSKSATTGLRGISGKAEGTLIAYASADNQVARYETGRRNSFYTAELVAALSQNPADLKTVLEQVQQRVFLKTQRQQTPYLYGFLSAPLYLGAAPVIGVTQPQPADDLARQAWDRAKGNRAMLEAFLREFPESPYARLARVELAGTSDIPHSAKGVSAVSVINLQKAILETKETKTASSDLEAKYRPRQARIENLQKELQQFQDQLKRDGASMSVAANGALTRQIDNASKRLQRETEDLQSDVDYDRNRILSDLTARMNQIIARSASSSEMILDTTSTVWASNTADITQDAIGAFDTTSAGGQGVFKSRALPARAAVIDLLNAITSTREGQKAQSDLQTKFAPAQTRIANQQGELERLQEQLRKLGSVMSVDANTALRGRINDLQKRLQRDTEDLQAEVDVERNKTLSELTARMAEVIGKFAPENQLTLVIERGTVMYAAADIDITREIIAAYDATRAGQSPAMRKAFGTARIGTYNSRTALGIGATDKREITDTENKRLRAAVEQYARANGLTLVLDGGQVLRAPDASDVSAEIRAQLR